MSDKPNDTPNAMPDQNQQQMPPSSQLQQTQPIQATQRIEPPILPHILPRTLLRTLMKEDGTQVGKSNYENWREGGLWLGWLALLGLFLIWRWQNIDAFGLNNDEGAYLMWSRLVAEGYALYSQTYTGSPPLFIEMLALVFKLFGFSIVIGRAFVLGWFILFVFGLTFFAKRISGWSGAYLALLLTGFLPPLFLLSRQVMLEIPAMTLALWGVLMGIYRFDLRLGHKDTEIQVSEDRISQDSDEVFSHSPIRSFVHSYIHIVTSGVCLTLSLLVKLLHPFACLPLAYLTWRQSATWLGWVKKMIVLGVVVSLTLLIVVSFFEFEPLFDQVIRFRAETRGGAATDLLEGNWSRLLDYLSQIWSLLLLALIGLFRALKTARGQAWAIWLLANLALVMVYNPVFPHHFSILLPPLLLLALEGVQGSRVTAAQGRKVVGWQGNKVAKSQSRKVTETEGGQGGLFYSQIRKFANSSVFNGLLFAIVLFNLPVWIEANQTVTAITTGGREAEAAGILAQVTRPDDFVMTDSQLLAHFADRLTPPPLVDFSLVYIQSGRHTPASLIAMSERYKVSAVASWALRMVWLPDYLAWVEDQFWVKKVWDNDHILYFGRKHPPAQPIPNRQTTAFTGSITLRGYAVEGTRLTSDASLPLTLYWQADEPLTTDYTIFVQLLDPSGKLAAQNDSQPLFGYFPTSQWPSGELIPDRISLNLPADLPPGEYTIIAGLYNWQTGDRLPLHDQAQDFVILTELELK